MSVSNFKFTYTPGPVKHTRSSGKLKPFLSELDLYSEILRDEYNPINILNGNRDILEVYRRMNGLFNTVAQARFNLCVAQLKSYPDFLSEDSDNESNLWVSSAFLNNAIVGYQSAFDLLLQVSWIFSNMYKEYTYTDENDNPIDSEISSVSLPYILKKCGWSKFEKKSNLLDAHYFDLLCKFHDSNTYKSVIDLANYLKHKQHIEYSDMKSEPGFIVISDKYNSEATRKVEDRDAVFALLKSYHNELHNVVKSLALLIQ